MAREEDAMNISKAKILPLVRLIHTTLFADDLPFWNSRDLSGDGIGKGIRCYGTLGGNGAGYGPGNWQPYGDGWSYGNGKGRGNGSGYGGADGNNP